MHRLRLASFVLALAVSASASAQGGWYAGFDVGDAKSDAEIDEHVFLGDVTARSSGSSTAYRLRGGYRFGRFFALELAYLDFGEVESHFDPDDCPGGAPGPCRLDARISASGIVANMVGMLPLGEHWYLDARMGFGNIEVEVQEFGATGFSGSDSSGSFSYGIGGGYRFNDHWEAVLDYSGIDQLDLGGDLTGAFGVYNRGETTMTSLGINYRW